MKIAILGTRGIPARYGGFETFAEELATRLVDRGHSVTVYCRDANYPYRDRTYRGVRLVILPTIRQKYLDTVFHTFLSILHSCFRDFDLLLVCNAANSLFCVVPRLLKKKVLLNVDGIERERKKWGRLGKAWYQMSEFLSTLLPNRIITDAHVIEDYYLDRYKKKSFMIPYGAITERVSSTEILRHYQLKEDGYILYASRLEPENNSDLVIKAFEGIDTDKPLIIVGDAPYAKGYMRKLMSTKDPRIIFTGYVFGQGYKEFQSHAYCYVHATEVGGTHPALLDAMGLGRCVLVNGTPENMEVVGEGGIIYKKNDVNDLREKLSWIIEHPDVRESFRQKARERVFQLYTWDRVTDQYEQLFHSLLQSVRN
jgi:glycosyltransferase involved in cell wall biosynthesis